ATVAQTESALRRLLPKPLFYVCDESVKFPLSVTSKTRKSCGVDAGATKYLLYSLRHATPLDVVFAGAVFFLVLVSLTFGLFIGDIASKFSKRNG
ncbi:hypothetical protein, partial [Ottowia sp.]|uniref:hypothetical protein n=1 Tax=Ottowia sp. TaxID=1898956 RepID=UPI002CD630D9